MTFSIEKSALWEEAGLVAAREQTRLLQGVAGGPPGYRLHRIVLTNFWLYEHQEFYMPHGRLFLAGDNRSGKSTVLTAAITLALDGDYRPERIDTFGKREKRIDYYVLGSNESNTPFTRDMRTCYIALEFEWCDSEHPPFASELRARWERGEYEQARFLTIGIAFHGNRNSASPITPLRFLITDGQRLEHDIPTMSEGRDGRRAIDLKTFRKSLLEHGLACDTQREYEQKVAQYLFNFAHVNDYRRLLKQLLYLRQPNLNSVLSLESVRAFLDQSLPALPVDLIQHAATTLELMESLQEEIERRRLSYDASEKLHRAQQVVAMAQARIVACAYVYAQTRANEAANDVQRLKRNITRAENELKRQQEHIATLEREQTEINGAITALEGSEGLQAAQRLSQAYEAVIQLEKDLAQQSQIQDDASARREQTERDIEERDIEFARVHKESTQLLASMRHLAEHEARWELATEQLDTQIEQVNHFALDTATPEITTGVSSLLEVSIRERLDWLRTLRQLHRELERIHTRLQAAQQQEASAYDAFDEVTRQFDAQREAFFVAQQGFADRLDTLLDQSDWQTSFVDLHERAAMHFGERLTPQETLDQLGSLLREYERATVQVLEAIKAMLARLRHSLEEARRRQGEKSQAASQTRDEYEQALRKPEYVPTRSAHRVQARQRLASNGIRAIPFYMLIDFAEDLDSASPIAGGIEHMLEDAGLLDALVVLPEQTEAADALLAKEGLSDCRLTLPGAMEGQTSTTSSLLRVDPTIHEQLGNEAAAWEAHLTTLLPVLTRTLAPVSLPHNSAWKHGLLSGIAGHGAARCIGKATRVREQQREQERLRQQWEELEGELRTVTEQIEALETERQRHEALRDQLAASHQESEVGQSYNQLQSTYSALKRAEERYQQARSNAQDIRQQVSGLKAQLQREAGDAFLFASDASKVELAYEATQRLPGDQKVLALTIERLLAIWQRYKQAEKQLGQDKNAEMRAELARRKAEQSLTRARSERDTLIKMVEETERMGIDSLLSQLQAFQQRQGELPEELRKASEQLGKAQNSLESNSADFEKALETRAQTQQSSDEAYAAFRDSLMAYPVELLANKRQQMRERSGFEIAQELIQTPDAGDTSYLALKEGLEGREKQAQNELYKVFSEVTNLLHEYAPLVDEHGIIRFANADNANAYELLTRLGEEIDRHNKLLETRERELFQNFLLEEMADTVGKYIADAEQWVARMNTVLGQTPLVGEYYHLRWSHKQPDPTLPGNSLSQYHELLRRQSQTLKQEEVDALVHAFRQEISGLRKQQQNMSEATFSEALGRIFDYRNWFQFEIYINRSDGTQQHLTNRFFKKGSGAEQYVTLYVPFFAALSALYESAGRGAPRLIALDEAFDKVSSENTRKLLKFLASQQFQWIMTGPAVSGEGADIPACVKYTMFCQKEQELATGFPSFWSTDLSLTEV